MIKTSKNCYGLLQDKLTDIERAATDGILNGNTEQSCLEIKTLVLEAMQTINENFYVADDDEPPAA